MDVLVQGMYFRMFPFKTAVIMSMVVDRVVLVLELRISKEALKDVHHALSVSLYVAIDTGLA